MAGYSLTPLWKKLGYKSGLRVYTDGSPSGYDALLALPKEFEIVWLSKIESNLALAHIFSSRAADLGRKLVVLRQQIARDGAVWVSWPKKASGVRTDISEDTIRTLALPLGFVDIKVCAVDETWSGLKLVIRKSERKPK